MTLTVDDIKRLAHLAALQLTPAEETRFAGELSSIFDYVKQLEHVDVSELSDDLVGQPLDTVTRPDEVVSCPTDIVDAIIAAIPDTQGRLIKVPNVFTT